MKILLLNSFFKVQRGGTEVLLDILAHGLRHRGHSVTVLSTMPSPGKLREEIDGIESIKLGIRNLYWPDPQQPQPTWRRLLWHAKDRFNTQAAKDVSRVVHDVQPEVVSLHNLSGFSSSVWPAIAKLDVPMAQMLHDYSLICPNTAMFKRGHICAKQCASCAVLRSSYRELSNKVSATIACSQTVLNIHRQEGYFLRVSKQVLIPHARQLQTHATGGVAPNMPLRDPNTFTFGFIGTLSDIKGIEMLLESFVEYINQPGCPPTRLLVAGDGRVEFVNCLKARFAHDSIVFLGRVNPAQFYPLVDASVVPSLWNDTFPFVVYEALGFGVPVIGSCFGGIPEVIRDGETGLIFDPHVSGALLSAMRRISQDSALRRQMAALAPLTVTHLLDENRFVDQHESLYLDLVRQHKARRTA